MDLSALDPVTKRNVGINLGLAGLRALCPEMDEIRCRFLLEKIAGSASTKELRRLATSGDYIKSLDAVLLMIASHSKCNSIAQLHMTTAKETLFKLHGASRQIVTLRGRVKELEREAAQLREKVKKLELHVGTQKIVYV